jgi:hypothetical protein
MMSQTISKTVRVTAKGEVRVRGLPFTPGEEVKVTIEPVAQESVLARIARLGEEVGAHGPADSAERHDDYLYGPTRDA